MSLSFTHPWALLSLLAVAAAGAAALWRRGGTITPVSSLRLWHEALGEAGSSRRRPVGPSAAWALLLAGAAVAAMAVAGPVWHRQGAYRRIALRLHASAELANPPGPIALRQAAEALLDCLDAADRVQLVWPAGQGGAGAWLSPAQARARLAELVFEPVPAWALELPPADPAAQLVYDLVPATLDRPVRARHVRVPLATTTPALTLDALSAETLADGRVQVLAAVRNWGAAPAPVELVVSAGGEAPRRRVWTLAPGERRAEVFELPPLAEATAVRASVGEAAGQWGGLEASTAPPLPVAVMGRENPFVGRFLRAMGRDIAVVGVDQAEGVLAIGVEPLAGVPAVVFDPRVAPPGWRLGEPVGPVHLGQARLRADAGLLEHVDLAGVAVRSARPFVGEGPGTPLVRTEAGVLLLAGPGRRMWVAFDPAPDNSNWGVHESFPLLLAEALAWLAPGRMGPRWQLAEGSAVGLAAGSAPAVSADALPLPAPLRAGRDVRLRGPMAALAAVGWLSGWTLRLTSGGRRAKGRGGSPGRPPRP